MKKALREMQTLRTGCSKAEPKKFRPAADPFPGTQDGQNLISWRWSLLLPTNPVWCRSMHPISSYRGNGASHTQTHTSTHRQDRLQNTALQLASVSCNYACGCWCIAEQSRYGSCAFLIRNNSACAGEFVLSFNFKGKCLHYNITYTNDYKYCFENGPHFAGIDKESACAVTLYTVVVSAVDWTI